jgi:hypothetical protein
MNRSGLVVAVILLSACSASLASDVPAPSIEGLWYFRDAHYFTSPTRPLADAEGECGGISSESFSAAGVIEELSDDSYFLEGFECRLGAASLELEATVECKPPVADAPRMLVKNFSLTDGVVSMNGDFTKGDFRYCFSLEGPVQRVDAKLPRHQPNAK